MWEQRPRAIRQHRPPRPCRHRRRRRTRGTASSTRGERVIREAMAMASGLAAPRGPWLGPEPPDLACPAGMRRVRFGAMGTTVSMLLPEREAGSAAVRDLFVRWEGTLSRFLPESELASLNRQAGQAVAVSPLLYEVIVT